MNKTALKYLAMPLLLSAMGEQMRFDDDVAVNSAHVVKRKTPLNNAQLKARKKSKSQKQSRKKNRK